MEQMTEKEFPSPVGESYFSIRKEGRQMNEMTKFPSPVGESYFSIWKCTCRKRPGLVSVPCRGILFFNKGMDTVHDILEISFRPLSGNLIFQFSALLICFILKNRFPSPVGESYFSI